MLIYSSTKAHLEMKVAERSKERNHKVNSLSYSTNEEKHHGTSTNKSHMVISMDNESTFDEIRKSIFIKLLGIILKNQT